MLIILEGPDGAGKSTIAEALFNTIRRDRTLLHFGPPDRPSILEEYVIKTAGILRTTPNVIIDRFCYGELVYPQLTGRPSLLDASHGRAQLAWTDNWLRAKGALLVHVTTPPTILANRLRIRAETLDYEHQHEEQVRLWYTAMETSTLTRVEIDTSIRTIGRAVQIITSAAHEAQRRCANIRTFEHYVGSSRPSVLLVGDRRGVIDRRVPGTFAPVPGGCAPFLLEAPAIERAFRAGELGLANACDGYRVDYLWEMLGRPPVVGLGRHAQRELGRRDVPHGSIAHPQFLRRFHYSSQGEYGQRVLNAACLGIDDTLWRPSSPASTIPLTPCEQEQ